MNESRWVVVDVETSGLDSSADRLLSIAAIAVQVDWTRRRMSVHPGDSFEAFIRQESMTLDRENIMVHRIGVEQQSGGVPLRQALPAFADFAGRSPLLAFHSSFDEAMLQRHAVAAGGRALANPWADIEQLCAVTHQQSGARSLDEWLDFFGIRCPRRHDAAADALAECEVLLRIWPRIAAQCHSWADVSRLAASHRWIRR